MTQRSGVCALIPAAGYGTRQLPASRSVPKELLPVFDRPCLQYALDEAAAAGLRRICLVTMRGKTALEDYTDANPELDRYLRDRGQAELADALERLTRDLQIAYVRQPGPRGLGDAVLTARPLLGGSPFAVMLADDLVDQARPLIDELLELQAEVGGAVVALQAVPRTQARDYGMAAVERTPEGLLRVLDLVEKPAPADAPSDLAVVGRYVLPPDIFDVLAHTPPGRNGELQLTDALSTLARAGRVHGVIVQGQRFDVGTPIGLLEASLHFAWKQAQHRPALVEALRRLLEETP
jgi:UTP--glucose-1-phosphate uridylyltransferase